MSVESQPLDHLALSALLSSRLCHDLINPVGALGSGLEVLDDPDMDQAMRDAALDLIRSGGEKSIALLKYARLAYGAAGGFGAEIPMEDAGAVLKDIFRWAKADLDWRIAPGPAPKNEVKSVLILAHAAADCVPRGGTVSVRGASGQYQIEASGPRAILQEDLIAAVRGETTDLKPKFAPAYIAGLMAREAGGEIAIGFDGDKILMRASLVAPARATAIR